MNEQQWPPGPIDTPRLRLLPLEATTLRALIAGDYTCASQHAGCTLTPEFRDSMGDAFLAIQLELLRKHPDQAAWCVRAILRTADGAVVGHGGFHGPPAVVGRTEIGYHVFAAHRLQGYATEAARGLIDWAVTQGQSTVQASISPDNAASLTVVRRLGFRQIGTDESAEGTELLFAHQND